MHQCISIIHAKPECVENVIEAAKKLVQISRSQSGNIYYNVLRSTDDPNTVLLIEKWDSLESFLGHVAHAGEAGDPVHEFGLIAEAAGTSEIYNCEILE